MRHSLASICLPVYNDAETVRETLESLLAQTYPDIEIVVCDNASTDYTGEIVSGFRDPRIRYHRNKTNLGPFPNWNRAVRLARGEYVAVYHADDLYHPGIVTEEIRFLHEHPEAAAVLAMDDLIDPAGRKIGESRLPASLAGGGLVNFEGVFGALLEEGNHFLRCPTFMMRQSTVESIGLFDESLEPFRSARDLEYYLRILLRYPIGILDQRLAGYRLSPRQATAELTFLRTAGSDFHPVMDHFLSLPEGVAAARRKPSALETYRFCKRIDVLFRASNHVLKGDPRDAARLLDGEYGLVSDCLARLPRLPYLAYLAFLKAGLALGSPGPFVRLVRRIVASRVSYY